MHQCCAGLVDIEKREAGIQAFVAPPARMTPLSESEHGASKEVPGTGEINFNRLPPTSVNNGPRWLTVSVASLETCLAFNPEPAAHAPPPSAVR